MTKPSAWEKEAARITSEVARRAIRRLDVLEWVILAVTVGLAIGGGWLLAWILFGTDSDRFRLVWMIASLLLFVVPGVIVFAQLKRDARSEGAGPVQSQESEDG